MANLLYTLFALVAIGLILFAPWGRCQIGAHQFREYLRGLGVLR